MRLPLVPLLALALATTGCSTIGLKQSLDPQVEEAREMREQLAADWEAVGAKLDSVERELIAFGDHRINTEQVDPAVLNEVVDTIELPDDADADDVENAQEQVEARFAAYQKSLEELDAEARATLEEVRTSGTRIKQQLYVEIPASMADIAGRTGGMAIQLAKIKGEAEQAEAMAEKNPLMTDADDLELEQDQAELDREMDALAELAQKISGESTAYADRLSAATAKFNLELSSFTD